MFVFRLWFTVYINHRNFVRSDLFGGENLTNTVIRGSLKDEPVHRRRCSPTSWAVTNTGSSREPRDRSSAFWIRFCYRESGSQSLSGFDFFGDDLLKKTDFQKNELHHVHILRVRWRDVCRPEKDDEDLERLFRNCNDVWSIFTIIFGFIYFYWKFTHFMKVRTHLRNACPQLGHCYPQGPNVRFGARIAHLKFIFFFPMLYKSGKKHL